MSATENNSSASASPKPAGRYWTASELRKLPAAERDAILMEAAERAAVEYESDPSLTDFEAFGKDDLYGSSSDTEQG